MKCKHPSRRLYTSFIEIPKIDKPILCIGRCDCGETWTLKMIDKNIKHAILIDVDKELGLCQNI